MSAAVGRLAVLAAAVLFSTGGAAIKLEALSASQVSMLRSGIAAAVLCIWYRRQLRPSAGTPIAAVVYAATLTLFVAATKLTTAANAIFLQSTAPIYIVVLGPWLLRERASRSDLVYLLAVGVGMALCFQGAIEPQATAPDPGAGNVLALASGLAWAFTLMTLRYLDRNPAPGVVTQAGLTAVVAGNAVACITAVPWALPLPEMGPTEWVTVLYLGIVQIGLAYACLTSAMRRLPALEVSLLLLIEPVLNPVWTWLILGEHPGRWTMAGGAVILGATALRTVWMRAR